MQSFGVILSLVILVLPKIAWAHGDFAAFSDLQSGMLHPFLDWLATMHLAVATLFIADQSKKSTGQSYIAFILGLLAASLIFRKPLSGTDLAWLHAGLCIFALIITASLQLSSPIVTSVLFFFGVTSYLPFIEDAAELSRLFVVGMILVYTSVYSWLILASRRWNGVMIFKFGKRLLGSWLAAANIMLLILILRGVL